ncbi:MAG: hypothetical protein RRC34_09275 [Lentisphaeria bacterium]|nr:hypothetical protein [Lentisphaeria bacterium]
MIELYARTIELPTGNGKTLLCDPERLQGDLRDAFRTAGIKESWPADQVLSALNEETVLNTGSPEEGVRDGVNQLVIRLLVNAGYPEVATEFARQHELLTLDPDGAAARSEWDTRRVAGVIAEHVVTSAALHEELASLVTEKLRILGFQTVTDALIIHVAEHTLGGLAQAYRTVPQDGTGWLMPSGYWEAFFSGSVGRLMASGTLKIHPVSQLFPVLRLSLDAQSALTQLVLPHAPPGTGFAEAWEIFLETLVEATTVLIKETGKFITANQHHPALIHIAKLDPVIQKLSGRMPKKKREAVAGKAAGALKQALQQKRVNAIVSLAS